MPTTTETKLLPLGTVPGVCPDTDCTNANTDHFTAADKIRFVKGKPRKILGWREISINNADITGCIRTIFSAQLSSSLQVILGGDENLYSLTGSEGNNITPLEVSSTAIADSLDTNYNTLATDPINTTDGSDEVIIDDTYAELYLAGDTYTISGATSTGGIDATELNKDHIIREVLTDKIKIKTLSEATSTAAGGGSSVVRSSGLLTVNATAHGQSDGSRVEISGAVDTGGIAAAEINLEFQIRNVLTDSFGIMTAGTSTSSVTSGGGSGVEYDHQIDAGFCDEQTGQGYGMAKYGTEKYGTALLSSSARKFPRIWFCDTFGDNIIMTPGNGGKVYTWDGSLTAAPVAVTNAPTQVNYAFVSNNILVTFGENGVKNRITGSDQNDITQWTSSSTNQVFRDDIEGAGRFVSHVSLNGTNLIFTNNQCYTFRYIGLPAIWSIRFKDNIGIVGPMARVMVKGVAYWMGYNNFYEWRGGKVNIMRSNTADESTLINYVFENINRSQLSKCFAWYNKRFDEIWFHYPSEASNEVDRVARYNVTAKHWTPDTFDRLAAEYPILNSQFPRLIDSNGVFYRHEIGHDDNDQAMPWSLKTNLRDFGTDNVLEPIIIPDSIQTGSVAVKAESYSYPQSALPKNIRNITINPETAFSPLGVDGRFIQYTFTGEALGQEWIMGNWQESIQQSSKSE